MTNQPMQPQEFTQPKFSQSPLPVEVSRSLTVRSAFSLDVRHEIAFRIAAVPDVQAVFTTEYGREFFVWIVVPKRDHEAYKRLFDVEKLLIDDYPAVHFDFTIMASAGRDPRRLVTDPKAQLVYARI